MKNGNLDIYFDKKYAKLYEKFENGVAQEFNIKCEYGEIKNIFIKRKITTEIEGKVFFDITTPYGYGGPIIINCERGKEKFLLEYYEKIFGEYCIENNIVSEFIRFHPIIGNGVIFEKIYDVEKNRVTLGTNLDIFDDPVDNEFSKSCKKNIRRALKKGVTFEIEESPRSVDDFIKVYYSTMDRNDAKDFYYFDKEYFEESIKFFKENIIIVKAVFEGKVIAAGFYFISNDIIHIHLSGTLSEYLYLSPAYVLRYAVTIWGKEKGYKLIHHGGGRTNSLDDGLYKFKKNFSKNTEFDFYIGRKIWNESIYKKLCLANKVDESEEFFPAYRK